MRRSLRFAVLFLFMAVLFACQKELSFEVGQPARGSLQSASGDCLPKNIKGTYKSGQALADSNYIEVTIDFGQTGAYTVYTDTVNGYSFKGTGTVTNTGVTTIRLAGSGTPSSAGLDDFTVFFDTTLCFIEVPVISSGSSSGGTAAFALQGNGAACSNSNVAGTYTQGTPLTAANQVSLEVNVTTVGTWTMSSSAVAGFSFSGSGTFTNTGVQTIVLTGSGNPTTAGAQTFSVVAGSTTCTFPVTVVAGTPPPVVGDHFILTNNSWLSYTSPIAATDTIKRTIVGSITANGGFVYKIMKQKNTLPSPASIDDSLYYRKSGNNYYEFNFVDYYTSFYFDNLLVDSILFLKEGLTTNQTWSSREYADSVDDVPTKVRYDFKCDDANATVTINGKTYTNVYKITLKVMVNEDNTGWDTDVTWTNYYAAGIGWIYQKYDDGTDDYELPVRFYQVF
ncbi:MAG TPA: hypothetical protein VFR58_08110 [Flavisolibacter sp.]|nr:hypothetical protein [Flavisolibacter sp.]